MRGVIAALHYSDLVHASVQEVIDMAKTYQKRKMNWFQITQSLLFIVFVSTFVTVGAKFSWPNEVIAQGNSCQRNDGMGSVFYNFRNLYVYYAFFSKSIEENGGVSYPKPLTFESFNSEVLKTIHATFSNCLKNSDGTEKSIIVIPPDYPDHWDQRIHDPRDLTIWINKRQISIPEIEGASQPVAIIEMFFYRPDVAYKNARLPMLNNSSFQYYPHVIGDAKISQKLQANLRLFLAPHASPVPIPKDEGRNLRMDSSK